MLRFAVMLTTVSFTLAFAGCGPTDTKTTPKVEKHEEHEEGHHHPGPNGGLVAAIGEEHKHHLEWTHDDAANSVTLIVLDANKSKEVLIEMEQLEVVADGKTYTLDAVNPQDGKASRFEAKDAELLGTIEALSDKITAEVREIEIGGEKYTNVKLVEDHDHD